VQLKEKLTDITIVIFVSSAKKQTLTPLIENKLPIFFLVAGKRIIDWLYSMAAKIGIEKFILLYEKGELAALREQLSNYQEISEPIDKIGNFTLFAYESSEGLSNNEITALQDQLTKYSLWIDGNVIFSERFFHEFLQAGLKAEKLFLTKQNEKEINEESAGIGFLERQYLDYALMGAKTVSDIFKRVREEISKESKITTPYVVKETEFWQINYPWELLDANQTLITYIEKKLEGKVEKGVTIIGKVAIGKGTRVRAGSYLEGPLTIGEDCDIGPNCYLRKGVVLGRKVRVGNACELKNTIVEEGTHIAHLSYVGDSIIGANCNFGAGTITGNLRLDNQTVKSKVGTMVLSTGRRKVGAIIGDNVKTAINVYFMPGVIVGNNAAIGTSAIITRNVPAQTFVFVEQQLQTRAWKPKKTKK